MSIPISSARPLVNFAGVGVGTTALLPTIATGEKNPKGYFTLYGNSYLGTNQAIRFAKNGTFYQVPVGKTCKVEAIAWWGVTSGGGAAWELLSNSDSWSNGTNYASLATTTVLWQGGGGATGFRGVMPMLEALKFHSMSFTYEFTASSYPGYAMPTNYQTVAYLLCREE